MASGNRATRLHRAVLLAMSVSLPAISATSDFAVGRAAYGAGDFTRARQIWEPLAERGDADAQFGLGMLCSREPPVAGCDLKTAAAWYARAAVAGHRLAQFNLGMAYKLGKGVEQDEQKASHWFDRAAAQGLAPETATAGPDDATAETPAAADATEHSAQTEADTPPPATSTATDGGLAWLGAQPSASFSIQLAAAPFGTAPAGLRSEFAGEDVRVVCIEPHCYVLLGVFTSAESAWQRIAELPATLARRQPWPRSFGYYQAKTAG